MGASRQRCFWPGAKRSLALRDRWLAVLGSGYVPSPRPRRDQPRDRNCRRLGQRVNICAGAEGTDGFQGHTGSRLPTTRPTATPMLSASFLLRTPPPLLLLLLSPWPVWAATPTGTPSAQDCPEACACAPGGQANCSGRALPAVPAGLNPSVRALLLDHNHVRALPPGAFVGAGALLRLDLRENGLRRVHARAFWGLGALQQLDLSSNQLEALAPGTFVSLRALCKLSLADNRLARLEPTALGALPLLRALSLQDNELTALAPGVLAGLPALNSLRLHGNPWACGCSLRPLCAWLRRHPLPAPEAETLLCVSPGLQALSPLTAFPDTAFRRCVRSLTPRDLVVVYTLGPVSFLASLATCLALGSVLTAWRVHRQRAAACRRRRPPLNLGLREDPADPAQSGSPAATARV